MLSRGNVQVGLACGDLRFAARRLDALIKGEAPGGVAAFRRKGKG